MTLHAQDTLSAQRMGTSNEELARPPIILSRPAPLAEGERIVALRRVQQPAEQGLRRELEGPFRFRTDGQTRKPSSWASSHLTVLRILQRSELVAVPKPCDVHRDGKIRNGVLLLRQLSQQGEEEVRITTEGLAEHWAVLKEPCRTNRGSAMNRTCAQSTHVRKGTRLRRDTDNDPLDRTPPA